MDKHKRDIQINIPMVSMDMLIMHIPIMDIPMDISIMNIPIDKGKNSYMARSLPVENLPPQNVGSIINYLFVAMRVTNLLK